MGHSAFQANIQGPHLSSFCLIHAFQRTMNPVTYRCPKTCQGIRLRRKRASGAPALGVCLGCKLELQLWLEWRDRNYFSRESLTLKYCSKQILFESTGEEAEIQQQRSKRQRTATADCSESSNIVQNASLLQPPPGSGLAPGIQLPAVASPSLERFWTDYMQEEAAVVITGRQMHSKMVFKVMPWSLEPIALFLNVSYAIS